MRGLGFGLAAVLLFAITAGSQPMERRHDGKGPSVRHGERLKEMLELTSVQSDKFDLLKLQHQKKMIQIRSQIKTARLDLRQLQRAKTPDRKSIETALKNINDMELQAKLARTDFWFSVRELLTPEQQLRWNEHRNERGHEPMRGKRNNTHRKQRDEN